MNRFGCILLAFLCTPALAQPVAAPEFSPQRDIVINMKAVEELAGAATAAELAARLKPEATDPLADRSLFTPIDPHADGKTAPVRGETLQILYARGSLIISPSAEETLHSWTESFLTPQSRVEILSYSGTVTHGLEASSSNPGNDLMTYSLHEAIRTAFKRAIVVRDILIKQGIASDNITVRALGPAGDGGAPERIDVIALTG